MSYACIYLQIPFPIKAIWEKGSGHSPLEGITTPFLSRATRLCLGRLISHLWRMGGCFSYILLYFIYLLLVLWNLLAWYWFTKPNRFQEYNSLKHHGHTASCSLRPKHSLFSFPLPTSTQPSFSFFSGYHHTVVGAYMLCMYGFFFNPFTFFHLVSQPPSSVTAVSLFHVFSTPFLFCWSVHFVH